MTGERRIPAYQVPIFMRALAKRARRRVKRGWKPTCEHVVANVLCGGIDNSPDNLPIGPMACGDPATHVDHNSRPLCDLHAAGVPYAERI